MTAAVSTCHCNISEQIVSQAGWGNEVLYRMCAERPAHGCIDTVAGKLWLIGRSYAAAIERGAGKGFRIETAAQILIESKLDAHIGKLNAIVRTEAGNAHVLLSAHHYLTGLLEKATGQKKRSLASKYLHFHAPAAVFLYDSISASQVRKQIPAKRLANKPIGGYDDAYSDFVARCLAYRCTFERQLGAEASPRRIDMELQGYWKQRIAYIDSHNQRTAVHSHGRHSNLATG